MSVHPTEVHISKSQQVYGIVIHWITIASAIVAMVAPVLILLRPEHNVLNPNFIFAAIWEGQGIDEIWAGAEGGFPGAHFYLQNFWAGDGFAQFGIAFGCSVAVWGLIPAIFNYIKEKEYVYAGLGLFIAALIIFALLDI